MFSSITRKLISGLSIVLIIIVASTIYNVYSFMEAKEHLKNIKEKAAKILELSNEMKNDIIQTRLYLADVSASKNTSELKKSEEHANLFKNNSSKLIELKKEYTSTVSELNNSFDNFYKYGKEMADIYIKSGHEEGNKMMVEFDKLADDVYKKVDNIQKKSQKSMDEDLMTIDMHMSMNLNLGIVIAILTIIMSLIIVVVLGRGISKPINSLLEIFKDLEKGQGDLTRRIDIKTKDEIAKMAQAFNRFMDSLENMFAKIKYNSLVVSKGAEGLSDGGLQTTEAISHINSHMNRVTSDSQKISTSINQITESISEIAKASQATAVDAQEISSSAGEINTIAKESGKLALEAKIKMEKIEKISTETLDITEKLGNEADAIGKIIDTIKAITDQTNLLALNAAIEAARAGEQGKGFGVVADEIRKLAESSNQSAKMIENLVKNIQNMIMQTVNATSNSSTNIRQGSKIVESVYVQLEKIIIGVSAINDRIQSIAAGTEEQSASTEELSSAMEAINISNSEISFAVQQIATSISGQAEVISSLSSTASDLNGSAEQLNNMVNKFKLQQSNT